MKRLFLLLLSLALVMALFACASKKYTITTSSGRTFVAHGTPEYDVQTETYKFQNEKGKEVIINQEDIEVIQEQ